MIMWKIIVVATAIICLARAKETSWTWTDYHSMDVIYKYLDLMAKTYPKLVNVSDIGKTHEGRAIKMLKLSNGNSTNKAILIDGGIHAREWISPATVTYFIYQFVNNFEIETDDIKSIDWYFIPLLNPDGYEYTQIDRMWRKNRRPANDIEKCEGTDLNRNFGYQWGSSGYDSNDSCDDEYHGSKPFSEPESRALRDFVLQSGRNFSAYLTYHSYSQLILYPWGYDNVLPPDYKELIFAGKKISEAIYKSKGFEYKVEQSSELYPARGASDDWAKSQGIKYSYTIELNDKGYYGFKLPPKYIKPVALANIAGLRAFVSVLNKT